MAIYSTFFVAAPDALLSNFPGWKPPLDKPVQREVELFGEKEIIETREPLWDDVQPDESQRPEYSVVAIEGDYATYLEQRLPSFVRASPHWCTKGLTNVELDPLGKLTDGEPAVIPALFSHPSHSAIIQEVRGPVVKQISRSPHELAGKWAARMSTPDYTHSADGSLRLNDDWSVDDVAAILKQLVELAKKADETKRLYLLLEW
jgi:hypothetical protein